MEVENPNDLRMALRQWLFDLVSKRIPNAVLDKRTSDHKCFLFLCGVAQKFYIHPNNENESVRRFKISHSIFSQNGETFIDDYFFDPIQLPDCSPHKSLFTCFATVNVLLSSNTCMSWTVDGPNRIGFDSLLHFSPQAFKCLFRYNQLPLTTETADMVECGESEAHLTIQYITKKSVQSQSTDALTLLHDKPYGLEITYLDRVELISFAKTELSPLRTALGYQANERAKKHFFRFNPPILFKRLLK
jgi:hypothetical protein